MTGNEYNLKKIQKTHIDSISQTFESRPDIVFIPAEWGQYK